MQDAEFLLKTHVVSTDLFRGTVSVKLVTVEETGGLFGGVDPDDGLLFVVAR